MKNFFKRTKSNTQFYTVSVRTFVIPFCYGSDTANSYGFYGSATLVTYVTFDSYVYKN
jgi:hypothetical protein